MRSYISYSNYKNNYTQSAHETFYSSIFLPLTDLPVIPAHTSKQLLTVGNENGDQTIDVNKWNVELVKLATSFQERHLNDETVMRTYNAYSFFTKALDDPKGFGFVDSISKCDTGECIWTDGIYPSSAMHKLLAKNLADFLIGI